MPAAQVPGEPARTLTEAAEIYDSPGTGRSGRGGEIHGCQAVLLLELTRRRHGMHEVECSIYPLQSRWQRGCLQHIATHDLGAGGDLSLKRSRATSHAPDTAPRKLERAQQFPADITGGAGQEYGAIRFVHAPIRPRTVDRAFDRLGDFPPNSSTMAASSASSVARSRDCS